MPCTSLTVIKNVADFEAWLVRNLVLVLIFQVNPKYIVVTFLIVHVEGVVRYDIHDTGGFTLVADVTA